MSSSPQHEENDDQTRVSPFRICVDILDQDGDVDSDIATSSDKNIINAILRAAIENALESPTELVAMLRIPQIEILHEVFQEDPTLVDAFRGLMMEIDNRLIASMNKKDRTDPSIVKLTSLRNVLIRCLERINGVRSSRESFEETFGSLLSLLAKPISEGPAKQIWDMNRQAMIQEMKVHNFKVYTDCMNESNECVNVGSGLFGTFHHPALFENIHERSVPYGTKMMDIAHLEDFNEEVRKHKLANERCKKDIYPRLFRYGKNIEGETVELFMNLELVGPSIRSYLKAPAPGDFWETYIPKWEDRNLYRCLLTITRSLPALFEDFERLRNVGLQHVDANMGNVCFDLHDIYRLRLIDAGLGIDCDLSDQSKGKVINDVILMMEKYVISEHVATPPEYVLLQYFAHFIGKMNRAPTKSELRAGMNASTPYALVSEDMRTSLIDIHDRNLGKKWDFEQNKKPLQPLVDFVRMAPTMKAVWNDVEESTIIDLLLEPLSARNEDESIGSNTIYNKIVNTKLIDVYVFAASFAYEISNTAFIESLNKYAKENPRYRYAIRKLHTDLVNLMRDMMHPSLTRRLKPREAAERVRKIYNENKGAKFLQRGLVC